MNSNSPPVGGKEVSNIFDVRFAKNEGKIFHLTIGFVGDGCTSNISLKLFDCIFDPYFCFFCGRLDLT